LAHDATLACVPRYVVGMAVEEGAHRQGGAFGVCQDLPRHQKEQGKATRAPAEQADRVILIF